MIVCYFFASVDRPDFGRERAVGGRERAVEGRDADPACKPPRILPMATVVWLLITFNEKEQDGVGLRLRYQEDLEVHRWRGHYRANQ